MNIAARRVIWLGGLAAGLAWMLGWALARPPRWGWALLPLWGGAGLTLAVYAFEMLGVALQHRDDPAPRPRAGELLRAALREALLAARVFGWRQVWCSRLRPDPEVPAPGRVGVLLVHGYLCNRGFWPPALLDDLTRRGVPWAAPDLLPLWTDIETYAPQLEAVVQRLVRATGCMPLLVGHSMGGLVVRAWWRWRQGRPELPMLAPPRVLTLGTPHRGTWLGRGWVTRRSPRNVQQMQADSAWLQALAASEPSAWRARFTCVHSACDNVVFPPARALLPGASALAWHGLAHIELAHDARLPALLEALRAEAQAEADAAAAALRDPRRSAAGAAPGG